MLSRRASHSWSIAESSLLPFLYCTPTLARAYSTDPLNLAHKAGEGAAEQQRLRDIKQKWAARGKADAPQPRRRTRRDEAPAQRMQHAARRPRQLQSIPFEGDTGSATPAERLQNTTMTPREMQIFTELFRKGVAGKKAEAEAEAQTKKSPSRTAPAVQFPELLRPLAEEADQLRQQSSPSSPPVTPSITSIADLEIKDPQAVAIRDRMDAATTDIECWEVLRDQVFARLRSTPSHVALQTNFPALPGLLLHYMHLQTDKLPTKHSLGLVTMSELKKIGPLAFALGATTDLYNAHMRLLWRQYRDMQSIDAVLTEMDKEVYEVDANTQGLLEEILDHARNAVSGRLGESVQALWTMERKVRGVKRMREWKKIVDVRLREKALSDAQAQTVAVEKDEEHVERQRPRKRRLAAA